jgi:flavin-dependent dehydrogenase
LKTCDVIIVGGGPGGAACAWQLKQNKADLDCLILERASFPRTKLCAGWITPEVVADLQMETAGYPHRFLTFPQIQVHLFGLSFKLRAVQHSIRRYEFDDWLLQRAGVPVYEHYVKNIRHEDGYYIVDDAYRSRYLVGAGGTKCPVYRTFLRELNPRARELQAVALEQEFAYDWQDPNCHLWFFEGGLPGYSWYVPKQNGYLNVGIGGMAHKLKLRQDDIKRHWSHFIEQLEKTGLVQDYQYEPAGYSYYLRANVETVRNGNAFIVGDSAGLATRDLCEGIGPAISSGMLAARAISDPGVEYSLRHIGKFSLGKSLMGKFLEYMLVTRKQKQKQENKLGWSGS